MLNEDAICDLEKAAYLISRGRKINGWTPDVALWMCESDYGLFKTAIASFVREKFGIEIKAMPDVQKNWQWRAEFQLGGTFIKIAKKANRRFVLPPFQVTPMFPSIKIYV